MFSENLLLAELSVLNAIHSSNETRGSIDVSGRELGLPSHDSGFPMREHWIEKLREWPLHT
jgi:hypothetical protein